MTDPIQSFGEKGLYVTLDENDSSTLILGRKLYLTSYYYTAERDRARMTLRKLEPAGSYVERFTLKLPLKETMPPYGIRPDRKAIDLASIKSIKAAVGVLPLDEGITDLLQRNMVGPFVHAIQSVDMGPLKGKYMIELQTVIPSNTLAVPQ